MPAPAPNGRVLAWDGVVRLLHWLLAGLVAFDFVYDDGDPLHRVVGYIAAGVVALRLAWGAVAQGSAGLTGLLPSVRATLDYLALLRRGQAPRHAGHDPLGLWMVWLLWLLVLLLGLTGWMTRLDAFWGDEWLQDVHALLADALLVCIVLHLVGVLAMSWQWRENLTAAMITGRKRPLDRER